MKQGLNDPRVLAALLFFCLFMTAFHYMWTWIYGVPPKMGGLGLQNKGDYWPAIIVGLILMIPFFITRKKTEPPQKT